MKVFSKILFGILLLTLSFDTIAMRRAGVKSNAEIEIYHLAQAMFFEARNQSPTGQKMVAHVILNRVENNEFPNSVYSVIHQKGQFQWVHNHKLRNKRVFRPSDNQDLMKMAKDIYYQHKAGKRKDITRGAIFFSTGRKPAPRARFMVRVGGHNFYSLMPYGKKVTPRIWKVSSKIRLTNKSKHKNNRV